MYRILKQGESLIISSADDVSNAIRLENLSDLLRLRTRIEQYLLDQNADAVLSDDDISPVGLSGRYIDTVEARRILREEGKHVAASTIVAACAAGNIDGAEKRGARWWMPADAFYRWLNRRDRSA